MRLDLTFDEDSQIVHNTILRRISSGSSLNFQRSEATIPRSPIKTSDVFSALEKTLTDDSTDKKSYFLKGPKSYNYSDLINLLEETAGKKADLNGCQKEQTFKPTKFGFFQEYLYTQCYLNSQGIIHSSRTGLDSAITNDGSELVNPSSVEDFYTKDKFTGMKSHGHDWMKKLLLY